MKKILVRKNIPHIQIVIIAIIFLVVLSYALYYLAYVCIKFSEIDVVFKCVFITAAATLIPLLLSERKNNKPYISELILDNQTLTLVYKVNSKIVKNDVINFEDIKSIHATLHVSRFETNRLRYDFISCYTKVNIDTQNQGLISFTESQPLRYCDYSFMLRLLSARKELPNFRYEVRSDLKSVEEDIKHYVRYGRRLSFFHREWINYEGHRYFLIISFVALIVMTIAFLVLLIPPIIRNI